MSKSATPTEIAVFKEIMDHPDLTAIKLSDRILVADTTLQIYKRMLSEDKNRQVKEVSY